MAQQEMTDMPRALEGKIAAVTVVSHQGQIEEPSPKPWQNLGRPKRIDTHAVPSACLRLRLLDGSRAGLGGAMASMAWSDVRGLTRSLSV
jgi:hypothetical protein